MILGALVVTLGLAWLLYAEARGRPSVRWIAKPVASAGFLLAALDAPAIRLPHGTGWLLFAALLACAVGDVLLVPSGRALFIAGMGAFSIAHLAFIAWFIAEGVHRTVLAVALTVMLVFAFLAWRWLEPHLSEGLRGAVRTYVALVALMAAFALAFGQRALVDAVPLRFAVPAAGGVALCASDIAVARQRFVAPAFMNRAWGLPVYYGAQLLLASAVR